MKKSINKDFEIFACQEPSVLDHFQSLLTLESQKLKKQGEFLK